MSNDMDRPFSRFYAQLRRVAGEESEDEEDTEQDDWLGTPVLGNPRRRPEEKS